MSPRGLAAVALACAWAWGLAMPPAVGSPSARSSPVATPASAGHRAREGGDEVLARDPATLPSAPADRWVDWTPVSAVPDELRAGLERAGGAWSRRDLPAALASLFAVLEARPDYPPAWHQCGVIYFRLQRYGDAITAFERYLAAAPARVGDTRALGHSLYSLGRYAEAVAHYERVLAVEPESVEALRGFALAHLRSGSPGRALELLERAVELAPDHASAHAWIGQVHFDLERLDAALAAVDRARALDPFAARPWFLASRILFESGRDEEGEAARARFELLAGAEAERHALEGRLMLDPSQPALLAKLVEWCRRIGDAAGARSVLGRWLDLEPTDVPLRILVLDVEETLGDRAAARRAAEVLARVGADDPRAWQRLLHHYTLTGERRRLREARRRLDALPPTDG